MKKVFITGIVIVLVFVVVGVIAEDKIPLEARIKSMKGDVEVKLAGSTEWQNAARGMVLKEGASMSTAYGAEAELILADNSVVIVYQLTQLKIDKFFRERAKVKTGLDLKIGKIRAHVQRVGEELSDFNVVTPTSVVSVRGTGMDILQTEGTDVWGLKNAVEVRDSLGRPEVVRPGQKTSVVEGVPPTQVVVESMNRSKVNTAVIGEVKVEVQARDEGDALQVKPGEPGKSGSVS